MAKLSSHAAIAQPVERILGKDEVASSNLASSSIRKPEIPTDFRLSSFVCCMPTTTETDTKTDTGIFYPNHRSFDLHLKSCFMKTFSLQFAPILV